VAAQKKSEIAQERDEGLRDLWRWLATRFDAGRLVFVDESGMHTSMERLRSRAPRGERAYGKVPRNRGKNTTLIASMSLCGMGEAMCIQGATDAQAFEVYVEHFLAPSLCEGQVVVLDVDLGAHRPKRVRELIERRGAELVYLPSYSPDLNPMEEAFSKIKNILRKLGARSHEALLEAMEEALREVTTWDAAGWFDHCGYEVEVQYL
jgi:transposase